MGNRYLLSAILLAFGFVNTAGLLAQNVGIGTLTPGASAKLEIVDANRGLLIPRVSLVDVTNSTTPVSAPATSLLVYNTNAAVTGGSGVGFYYWTGTVWVRLVPTNSITNDWALTGNAGTNAATNFAGTTDAVDYVIRTSNAERMRVQSGGNVGIGTATPGYRLDLANGTFAFGNNNTRSESRNDAGLQGNAGAQSGFFETASPVNYPAGATSWWHLIDTRHSNPANNYALQISGSFFDQELYFRKTNSSATQAWSRLISTNNINTTAWTLTGNAGTSAATNFAGTTDAVDYVIRTANTEKMRVQSGGNVGIGIAAPTQRLDVQGGNARINTTYLGDVGHGVNWAGFAHMSQANTTGYGMISSADGNYTFINKQNSGGGYIGFRVGNNDMAVITNAGDMGVGTTGPGVKVDIVGAGGATVELRTTGRIWTNSANGGMWLSNLQDAFMGNISANQMGFWSSSVGWNALNITKSNGFVGIGTSGPVSRLHVIDDADNLPVVYGVNINATGGTNSFGVRGECGSSGLGSAGVSGVSTNSGQNEIGVVGDYALWGTGVFGMGWAGAYTDMPTTRDHGVFGTVSYFSGTGVYGRNTSTSVGSAYGVYCVSNFAVTGAKSASVPTTQGNQLVYSVESPGMWFEDLATGQLQNGQVHIALDDMFLETVFIDGSHPMQVFLQEQGECNGLYFVPDADGRGFSVKEKAGGSSNVAFSYRVMAKRRFYQDHRFGVDANQPMEDNLSKATYQAPAPTDPAEMQRRVDAATREKEAMAASMKNTGGLKNK